MSREDSLEAYNEVMSANLSDIREDSFLGDAVAVDDPFAPPPVDDPDPSSLCPPSPVTASIPESIDGSPAAPIEACLSEKDQTEDVAPAAPDVLGCPCQSRPP